MKKSVIALIGLFAFASCSDNAVESFEQTKNAEIQNSTFTYDSAIGYDSPYDINSIAPYEFYAQIPSSADMYLEITPILTDAYYDGDPFNGLISIGNGYIPMGAPTSNYPLLFANGTEMGNLYKCNSFKLAPGETFHGYDGTDGISINNGYHDSFDVASYGYSSLEEEYLKYGTKLAFYIIRAYDLNNGQFIDSGYIFPNYDSGASSSGVFNTPLASLSWSYAANIGFPVTNPFPQDIIYHNASKELVMADNFGTYTLSFTNPSSGNVLNLELIPHSNGVKLVI